MISSRVAGVDSTGAVQVMSPTVRKRTRDCSTTSPSRGGVSSVTGTSALPRRTTGRRMREVDRRHVEPLAADVLPDVELGPVRDREHADVLARRACARCRGSTARGAGSSGPTGRTRRGTRTSRSLARAFSSSRRAPPMQASKPNSAMASSSVTDWCGLRGSRRVGAGRPGRCGSSPRPSARSAARRARRRARSRKAITSGKLWPVSMCSSGNGKRPGRKAFSASRSSTSESLPPENSSAGLRHWPAPRAGCGWPPTRASRDGRHRPARRGSASALARSHDHAVMFARHVGHCLSVPGAAIGRPATMQPAFLVLGLFPPPAAGAEVLARLDRARAGRAADAGIAAVVQRVVRHVDGSRRYAQTSSLGPVGQRVELHQAVQRVELLERDGARRRRLLAAQAGDPGALAAQRAAQRLELADLAAALAQLDAVVEGVDAVRADEGLHVAACPACRRRSAGRSARACGRSESCVSSGSRPVSSVKIADRQPVRVRSGRAAPCPRRRSSRRSTAGA